MFSCIPRRFIRVCLAFLSWLAVSPVSRGEEETRRVSVHALSMDSAGIAPLFIRSGGTWIPLRAPATFIPDSVMYEGHSPLVIYRAQPTDPPGEPEYISVASLELPEGLDDVLLLLRGRSGEPNLDLRFISLALDEFPQGSFLFFNHTDRAVDMTMDGERMRLESGATQYVIPENREARTMPVNLVYAGDDERKSYVATTWFYRPSIRQLAVIVPEEDSSRFMVRVINLRKVDPGE